MNQDQAVVGLGHVLKVVVGVSSVWLMTSCGMLGYKTSGEVQPNRYSSLDGIMLATVEDPQCDEQGQSTTLSKAKIWQWDGAQAASQEVSFTGSPGEDYGLASAGVTQSIHSYRDESDCKLVDGKPQCAKARVINGGRVVKVCRDDGAYGRDSIESVTLTSLYYIGRAREAYEAVSNAKPNLANALLAVQPIFIKNSTDQSGEVIQSVQSSNAGYASASNEEKSKDGLFVVFPTAISEFEKSPLHLWEVPFVMGHEYGHNVFNHHVGKAADLVGLKIQSHVGLGHMIRRDDNVVDVEGVDYSLAAAKTGSELAVSGVNELFADLFSYYVNEEKSALLKGVSCLDLSRDPSSELTFASNTKIWSPAALSIFEGRSNPERSRGCGEPKFNNEHDVAAVLGYPIAQLMNAGMAGADSKAKLNLLVKSLDDIASIIVKTGKSTRLDKLMAIMVTTIVSERRADISAVTAQCEIFKSHVTGLELTSQACK